MLSAVGAALLILGMAGCAPEPVVADADAPSASHSSASGSSGRDAVENVVLVSIVDGDTVETSAGTVRIIGIDTPERFECGHDAASTALSNAVAPGEPVVLELPAGQNDVDRHGRLLRFVSTESGVDLGLLQLQAGNAVARYDSRDGYPAHPREADYHAAQLATLAPDGTVLTVECHAAALAPPPPAPPPPPPPAADGATDRWWLEYPSCAKLKKNTVGHPTGPFSRDDPAQVELYDWFAFGTGNRGDGDGDGLACE